MYPLQALRITVGLLVALGGVDAGACHFPYNSVTLALEAACYTVLGSELGYEVREYTPDGTLVIRSNISSVVTTYQEALMEGAYYVLGYFTGLTNAQNVSLLKARTTPLLLRPSRPASQKPWFVDMAIAPGLTPNPLPAPLYGVEVVPLVPSEGVPIQLAARHERLSSSPQPSDFEACAAKLVISLAGSTTWRYNSSSAVSPSYAYFTGEADILSDYDIECWVGVVRAV